MAFIIMLTWIGERVKRSVFSLAAIVTTWRTVRSEILFGAVGVAAVGVAADPSPPLSNTYAPPKEDFIMVSSFIEHSYIGYLPSRVISFSRVALLCEDSIKSVKVRR